MPKKLNSKVFRIAAKMVETGRQTYSCCAIANQFGIYIGESEPHLDSFKKYFKPDYERDLAAWFTSEEGTCFEDRDDRVTALLLMAEITESENL